MMRFFTFFLLLCLFPFSQLNTHEIGSCDLRCWLESLVIHVPDQTHKINSFITVDIKNLICRNFTIGKMGASLNTTLLRVNLEMSSLGGSCVGEVDIPAISAHVPVGATLNQSSLSGGIVLKRDKDGLASSASLAAGCVSVLHFFTSLPSLSVIWRSLVELGLNSYLDSAMPKLLCTELGTLIGTNLTQVLQDVDNEIRPYLHPPAPTPPPPTPAGCSRLLQNSVVGVIDYFLDDVVGVDGVLGINSLIDKLTNDSGSYEIGEDEYTAHLLPLNFSVPLYVGNDVGSSPVCSCAANANFALLLQSLAVVTVEIDSASVAGLNTWTRLDLLEPSSNFSLTSRTATDNLLFNVSFAVTVQASNSSVEAKPLFAAGLITTRLLHNRLTTTQQICVNADEINDLSDLQLANPSCLIPAIRGFNVTSLEFDLLVEALHIDATAGGSLEHDVDEVIDAIVGLFTGAFAPAIPAFINGFMAGPIRELANKEAGSLLYDLQQGNISLPGGACPSASEQLDTFDFDGETAAIAFAGAGGVCILLSVIVLFTRPNRRKRRFSLTDASVESTSTTKASTNSVALSDSAADKNVTLCAVAGDDYTSYSLAHSPRIPAIVRYGMPLLICLNIALFIVANLSVGASVYPFVTMDGRTVRFASLFDFSLGNSVRDMWHAGVYPLSILIAVFSGGWPYLKLVLMLVCWVLPARLLSVRWRESILMIIDKLGKWSLIDSYVLVMFMVAFKFDVQLPAVPATMVSHSVARVFIAVEPEWGFFSFLSATYLGLILTHIELAFHRHAVSPMEKLRKCRAEALGAHGFRTHGKLYRCNFFGRFIVAFLLLSTFVLVNIGALIQSFYFQFEGLAAAALVYLGYPSKRPFSLVSLGMAIPDSSPTPDSVAVRLVQYSFLLFALVVPLAHIAGLFVLWLTPLRLRAQRFLFVLLEVLDAWSALDVFLISILAALLQLRQLARFIIGDRCNFLVPILEKYYYKELDGDPRCFDVSASLKEGSWVLLAAVIVYWGVSWLVMRTSHVALQERTLRVGRGRTSSKPPILYKSPSAATVVDGEVESQPLLINNDVEDNVRKEASEDEELSEGEEEQDSKAEPLCHCPPLFLLATVDETPSMRIPRS